MHSFSHAQIFRCTTTKRRHNSLEQEQHIDNLLFTIPAKPSTSLEIYTHNIPSLNLLSKYNSCQSQSPEHSTIFVSKADTSLVQNQVHDEDDDDADLARALNPK
jgi:hypothetical protein